MSTVEIQSQVYDVYADVQEATLYIQAAFNGATWIAADELVKKQSLVAASRVFDRTCWLGDPAGLSAQALAWPRINTGIAGVADDVIPQDIIDGAIELALAMVNGSSVETNATPNAQQLEIIKAGSVMLQYFRGAESINAALDRFPLPVMEYVKQYMCGAAAQLTGIATGTTSSERSVTGDNFGWNEGL